MLTKIVVDGVATFKRPATLETDKRVNLIYGLNGSGKSTIARLLRRPQDPAFTKCNVVGSAGKKVLVFNEDFVRENFYESPTLKGIFSLSKQNKQAEEKIAAAKAERERLQALKVEASSDRDNLLAKIDSAIARLIDTAFEIKRKFSGGDRVLEFCLAGLMGNKEKLFDYLKSIEKPSELPKYTPSDLQAEVRLLGKVGEAAPEPILPTIHIDGTPLEAHQAFRKSIVGTQNSSLGDAINRLKNADWVRSGLAYVDLDNDQTQACPFCQHDTIDRHFTDQIRAYFDKSYDDEIRLLTRLQRDYEQLSSQLPPLATLQASKFYDKQIDSKYRALEALLGENRLLIETKLKTPSLPIELRDTRQASIDLANALARVNQDIEAHNGKIANRDAALANVKQRFWALMRWEHDQSLQAYAQLAAERQQVTTGAIAAIQRWDRLVGEQNDIITSAQKETVNVDAAIARINSELLDIGITDFRITKHSDHMYQLERPDDGPSLFHTLSEGEKMIIALFYFCERCEGNDVEDEVPAERVVVIDDPISSMSHIYVFNVGRLLRERFVDSKPINQVFILTHSLYFFYELTDINHDRRSQTQALFRVVKSQGGSTIQPMKYEEVQNDYQAYWQVINDKAQSPALIANCMRNVVEYFFGFVEKKSYVNVFQNPALSKNKFQAFNRYMNRESHSLGQNVFDLKEFDYDIFRDGLKQVFEASGYEEHYKRMARIP